MAHVQVETADRSAVLELYREHGPREASRQTGVPASTVCHWAVQAGVKMDMVPVTNMRQRLSWLEHQAEVTDALEELFWLAREKAVQATADNEGKLAREFTVTAAICFDKCQILSGEVTSRTESRGGSGASKAEIERLLAKLQARVVDSKPVDTPAKLLPPAANPG